MFNYCDYFAWHWNVGIVLETKEGLYMEDCFKNILSAFVKKLCLTEGFTHFFHVGLTFWYLFMLRSTKIWSKILVLSQDINLCWELQPGMSKNVTTIGLIVSKSNL